jgi:hypothetical protein
MTVSTSRGPDGQIVVTATGALHRHLLGIRRRVCWFLRRGRERRQQDHEEDRNGTHDRPF